MWAQRLDQTSVHTTCRRCCPFAYMLGALLPTSVPTWGPSPAQRQPLRVLRLAGGDHSPTGHRVLAWEEPLLLQPQSPLPRHDLSFWRGLHIRLHVALCLPCPHHQTQQTHRKQAPRSPQTLPERSSGFLEESPEPTASAVLGLGVTWGPRRGSCSSDTCQPPAPAFLAGRMRGLVSILGVGRSEGSRENHLRTQLYPHLSVGSVLLTELSVQSRPPFSVSHQARGQQAGHHGVTGSRFPGSRRCTHGLPPPTPEAAVRAPGRRRPTPLTQCPCPAHTHAPTPWPALHCPLGLGP